MGDVQRDDSLFSRGHLFRKGGVRGRKPVLAFVPNAAFDKIILAKQI